MPYIYNGGMRIYYETAGEGPPLLLHHGMSESLWRWRLSGMTETLCSRFRLILLDGRGHGWSDKPHDPAAYTLKARVTDVLAVLDELEVDQAHYFGHSLGGWVGLGLAQHAPNRLSSLSIGGAQPYGHSFAKIRQIVEQGLDAWVAMIEQMSGPLSLSEREQMRRNDPQALAASVAYDRPDISFILPSITTPCLFFAGEADPLHRLVQRCAAEVPDAQFVSLQGLNHFQVARQPGVMLPHLHAFWQSLPQFVAHDVQ